jgi:hypothetical protein
MKALKYIGFAILGLIALILLVAAFVPKDMQYEKSIVINAPIDSVWLQVNSLSAMDKWNPWNAKDPNMKKSISGTDGAVGATSSWQSDVDDVGTGSQTIAKIEAPTSFQTKLKFLEPFESEADAYVILAPENGGTKATWGFKSVMPYPFNISTLFMNMESSMGPDWTTGLNKLKTLSEN